MIKWFLFSIISSAHDSKEKPSSSSSIGVQDDENVKNPPDVQTDPDLAQSKPDISESLLKLASGLAPTPPEEDGEIKDELSSEFFSPFFYTSNENVSQRISDGK